MAAEGKKHSDTVILIPALDPEEGLISYTEELYSNGFSNIVVIDDGSKEEYKDRFKRLSDKEYIHVLTHEVNKGKGAAIKTACRYIKDEMTAAKYVITADSDGQHSVEDCTRIADALISSDKEHVLILGSRNFYSETDVIPVKSKLGNRITSIVFRLTHGIYLPDTQTGLRAFRTEDIDEMCDIPGDRYEYEMRVLIEWAHAKHPIDNIPIKIIYENNNEGSHFNPFKDSFKIYRVILETFFKYLGSSVACFFVDNICFNLISYLLLPALGVTSVAVIDWISGFSARIISASVNYTLNRNVVFKSKKSGALLRYVILCIAIICASNLAVTLLEMAGLPRWLMKPVVDMLLYFVSFKVQDIWVF